MRRGLRLLFNPSRHGFGFPQESRRPMPISSGGLPSTVRCIFAAIQSRFSSANIQSSLKACALGDGFLFTKSISCHGVIDVDREFSDLGRHARPSKGLLKDLGNRLQGLSMVLLLENPTPWLQDRRLGSAMRVGGFGRVSHRKRIQAGCFAKVIWVSSAPWMLNFGGVPCEGCFQFQHGFRVWDPGGVYYAGLGFFVLRRPYILVTLSFSILVKNKHEHLCQIRLWFHFLFSWVILELDCFYWVQWQYLPEAMMPGVCIVLGFISSIRVLDSSIKPFLWLLLLVRMPKLKIVFQSD